MGVFVTLTIRVGVFVRGINAPVVAVMTPRRVPVAVGEGIAVVLAASVSVPVEVAVSVGRLAAVGIGCPLRAFSALVTCPPTKNTTPTKAKTINHNFSPGAGG
jgi:hypothetical protein